MLRFSEYFSNHKETDRMIRQALNDRLTALLDAVLARHGVSDPGEMTSDDIRLTDGLQHYFPFRIAEEELVRILSGLYRLLKSPESLEPSLLMEYLLYQIIEERITFGRIYGFGTTNRLKDRSEIEKSIRIHEPDVTEHQIRQMLDRLEDLKSYREFCFWDLDFLILDWIGRVNKNACQDCILTGGECYGA